ncbi:hypothetical protein BB560_006442, partial [Smittium megazygosporum]
MDPNSASAKRRHRPSPALSATSEATISLDPYSYSKQNSAYDQNTHFLENQHDSRIPLPSGSNIPSPSKTFLSYNKKSPQPVVKSSFIQKNKTDLIIMGLLTLLSMFTRFYKISFNNKVTWDEAHFGKFGAYYINHTFYHDVHPPLAKMLVALAEVIAGHNGTFAFPSGKKYPSYVNYSLMRMQLAMYGVLLSPIAYMTCKSLYMSTQMSVLAGLFIIF